LRAGWPGAAGPALNGLPGSSALDFAGTAGGCFFGVAPVAWAVTKAISTGKRTADVADNKTLRDMTTSPFRKE
jgi:hypothetical protein